MFGWRRALAQAGLMIAGGLFLLASGALIAVAAWLWLAAWRDPVIASLIVSAGCALTAVVLFLLARPGRRRPPQPAPDSDTDNDADRPADAPSDRDAAVRAIFREAGLRVPERGESPALVEAFLVGLNIALRLRGTKRR
ncbi:phage holin family protein [Rhodobaculum claviforme]|uniref:Holin-X, holin superfamily III n=1 Tax=Rhodobaculum claviforme TaxID=1549854 RepID=A0A934TJL4_9RHOB|nr:phage holin family protein [Rhodobaculum claviforme]MBK5927304.1 hypothetical protein [Rhodobaculum claviforme]